MGDGRAKGDFDLVYLNRGVIALYFLPNCAGMTSKIAVKSQMPAVILPLIAATPIRSQDLKQTVPEVITFGNCL